MDGPVYGVHTQDLVVESLAQVIIGVYMCYPHVNS